MLQIVLLSSPCPSLLPSSPLSSLSSPKHSPPLSPSTLLSLQRALSSSPTVVDLEPGVEQLRKDLDKLDVATAAYLSDPKIKFVFEGMGQLLSAIFIHSAGRLLSINGNAIKKM